MEEYETLMFLLNKKRTLEANKEKLEEILCKLKTSNRIITDAQFTFCEFADQEMIDLPICLNYIHPRKLHQLAWMINLENERQLNEVELNIQKILHL